MWEYKKQPSLCSTSPAKVWTRDGAYTRRWKKVDTSRWLRASLSRIARIHIMKVFARKWLCSFLISKYGFTAYVGDTSDKSSSSDPTPTLIARPASSFLGSTNDSQTNEMRKLVVLFALVALSQLVSSHVSLIFPPARYPNYDFLDNVRTGGPCGVPNSE